MTTNPSDEEYFRYLTQRSTLGFLYRKYYLYPRLSRQISGLTLDIGCGIGDFLKFRPNTIGVDVNPKLVQYCQSRQLDVRLMSPDSLPFENSSFDSVVLDNVLEHIANPKEILAEIARVLKPRGKLLVGVPGIAGYNSDPDHKVFYDKSKLVDTCEASQLVFASNFYAPIESSSLSESMSQYCLYATFVKHHRSDSQHSTTFK
jgi:SAM-dependent methyltransferase